MLEDSPGLASPSGLAFLTLPNAIAKCTLPAVNAEFIIIEKEVFLFCNSSYSYIC
jgi:hypothetical protein